jgi:hypothetical protein
VRLAQSVAGLAAGLALAEGAFQIRDHGAFPHLNCYVADPVLGVRLRPGATEKVAFGGSEVTHVRINAAGLRGAELPPPADGEIAVVGDSQVFGLGVEEDQTASAALGAALGRPVVNAGVPTYGPPEYSATIEELFRTRRPRTVVYVVNFWNDFFEATRPNTERHAVWDGWAVRRESAPSRVTAFPGRELVYGRSHAVYALRRWWYGKRAPEIEDWGYPSEGSERDLLGRAAFVSTERAAAAEETRRLAARRTVELRFVEQQAASAEVAVEEMISRQLLVNTDRIAGSAGGYVGIAGTGVSYRAARANPGDIVAPAYSEEGRETFASAQLIREGAVLRAKLEADAKQRAAEDPANFEKIVRAIELRDGSKKRLSALRSAPLAVARALSPMTQQIKRAKEICDAHGAKLVVVGLPMDVMVFPAAWKKYPGDPVDLAPVKVLMTDLVESSLDLGAAALDATEALGAAGEGAFLPREFHLSPRGQRALGEAIARTMSAPPPPARPSGLPAGRSFLPMPAEWDVRETAIAGSTAANCTTKKVREWFSIRCSPRKHAEEKTNPLGVAVVSGGGSDALTLARGGEVTLIAPVIEGDELQADFFWGDHTQRLTIAWKKGDIVADGSFGPRTPAQAFTAPADPPALCACFQQVSKASTCAGFLGDRDAACATTYAGDCQAMLACSHGDPSRPPACPDGAANTGATGRCRKLCAADADCGGGACAAYQGARVCF